MTQNTSAAQISKAQELVAAADTGAHHPAGGVGRMLTVTAILWTLFQLWVASPLPYHFTWLVPVLNLDDTKIVHLAFAFFLVYAAYPARKKSARGFIPVTDWALMALAPLTAFYLLIFKEDLAGRMGAPTQADIIFAGIGMALLLEAARRALGLPLVVVAVFIFALCVLWFQ